MMHVLGHDDMHLNTRAPANDLFKETPTNHRDQVARVEAIQVDPDVYEKMFALFQLPTNAIEGWTRPIEGWA
jgi:hypothetical protein